MSGEQPLNAQRGEVEYRRRLVRQQVAGKTSLADEFDSATIASVLRERMERTRAQMESLRRAGVPLSPYLEIGAERGQRALVMENWLDARGAAADLSFDMLRACEHYRAEFGLARLPLRVCCDAYHLPFRTGSLPFVFCYETLHHFPEPDPIVAEAHRVLAPGGTFLFDEEPYRKVLHFNVYKGRKLYGRDAARAGRLRRLLDRVFAETACNEVEFGILENHDIPLDTWKRALAPFASTDVELHSARVLRERLFTPRNPLAFALAWAWGGTISGTCRKAGTLPPLRTELEATLACPTCVGRGEGALERESDAYRCRTCGERYPSVDGVAFLMTAERRRELYPETASGASD
jgi:SAM-dependent methyltransferase/uncharacterized protein YbaR (Trm112 family)